MGDNPIERRQFLVGAGTAVAAGLAADRPTPAAAQEPTRTHLQSPGKAADLCAECTGAERGRQQSVNATRSLKRSA
jgi:hypothetical protein